MISVIIPIFNAENYIHRCIDSILAQSYVDFELLLIDDGSTDSSGSICNEYALADNRVPAGRFLPGSEECRKEGSPAPA